MKTYQPRSFPTTVVTSFVACALASCIVAGCAVEGPGGVDTTQGSTSPNGAVGGGNTTPTNASFGGSYEVPVPPELAAAAIFDVPEINWVVVDGVATLSYNLPRALVGKATRLSFSGPFDAASGLATLSGPAGTSQCVVSATNIVCSETMQGLLPLNPNLTVVEALAGVGYAGPAADRIAVANRFAGDPIGVARIDLSRPGVPEPVEPVVPEPDPGGHK